MARLPLFPQHANKEDRAVLRLYYAEIKAHPKERRGAIAKRVLGQPDRSEASAAASMRVLRQGVRPKFGRTIYHAPRNATGGVYNVFAVDKNKAPVAYNVRVPEGTPKFAAYTPKGNRRLTEKGQVYAESTKSRVRCGEVDSATLEIRSVRMVPESHVKDTPLIVRDL